MPILHHISANNCACEFDAITFVGSMNSLEDTVTVCHNLELLSFSLPKIGGCSNFRSQLVEFFSFDKFQVVSVSKVICCCLMTLVADLKWREHWVMYVSFKKFWFLPD